MKDEDYIEHGFQMVKLVLAGLIMAAISFVFVLFFLFLIFTYDHMKAYGQVTALMVGVSVGYFIVIYSKGFPWGSYKPVLSFYLIVMALLIGYAMLFVSVPEKEASVLPTVTPSESKAFDVDRECSRIRRQYAQGAMSSFDSRSSSYGEVVIPSHCRR